MMKPASKNDVWWTEKPTRFADLPVSHTSSRYVTANGSIWRNAVLMVALMVAFGVSLGSLAGLGSHHDEQGHQNSQIAGATKTLQHSS